MLNFVYWNADPILFSLGPISVRWYGLMFAIGFTRCSDMREHRKNGLEHF